MKRLKVFPPVKVIMDYDYEGSDSKLNTPPTDRFEKQIYNTHKI